MDSLRVLAQLCAVGPIMLLPTHCGQLTREDLLAGNFGTVDKTPPKLIAPVDNGQIVANSEGKMKAMLTWEVRAGATNYVLEIATDAAFQNQVSNSPVTIRSEAGQVPKTIFEFEAEQPITHYWRVRANITESKTYSPVFSFHALDKVYVYCRPDVADCKAGQVGYGNRTFPFAGINQGIQFAKDKGIANVLVANRGASQNYSESVQVEKGVNLLGGYTSDFTEASRDVVNNRSRVASASVIMSAESINQSTLIEGLHLIGAGTTVQGISISECTSGLRIRSNSIHLTGLATYLRAGILIASSGSSAYNGPIIESNIITLDDINWGRKNTGIEISGSFATIESNVIRTGAIIAGNSGGMSNYGIAVQNASNALIRNNVIQPGALSVNVDGNFTFGVIIQDSTAVVVNNTIITDGKSVLLGQSAGIIAQNVTGGDFIVLNNLLASRAFAGTAAVAFGEWNSDENGSPARFENNYLFNATNLYRNNNVQYRNDGYSGAPTGDGLLTPELTGVAPVVAHNLTRGATETTSDLFVDWANRDYRPAASSRLRANGTANSWVPTTDILGATRPATPGIGAYE